MLKAIIIDDEAKSRRTLQRLVETYCSGVSIVATAHDILSGIDVIKEYKPHLLFLDIELPNHNGFKIFELLQPIDFKIIFTTAYEQYAHRAFKVAAEDYLLKPIDIDELIQAVRKVKVAVNYANSNTQLQELKAGIAAQHQLNRKFKFPTLEGTVLFEENEIIYFEAIGRNTKIYTNNSETITSKSLKECEAILADDRFCRIHRSFIINLNHVFRYVKGRNSYIMMDNELKIDIGNNFKEGLVQALSTGY